MNFKGFRDLISRHFDEMTKNEDHLFEVAVDKDRMWNLYLDSYPDGTNPIYRVNREYDCSCCRHFIKSIGNVVVVKNGEVHTVWDVNTADATFQPVADALAAYIRSCPVSDVFVTDEHKFGTHHNFERTDSGEAIEYDHFYLELPDKFVSRRRDTLGTVRGNFHSGYEVFHRALREITMDSIDDVLDLIASNSLYRGRDYKAMVAALKKYKTEYDQIEDETKKTLFAWEQSVKAGDALCRIRNTAIGTLLVALSNGEDLNEAVAEYTRITDPSNYKRPKAVFTTRMLESAKKDLTELGFMDSLQRRFANLDDITVNNILFANRDAVQRIEGNDPFAAMAKQVAVNPKKYDRVEEVPADVFVRDILPTANELELLLEHKHLPNFVSLIAPVNPDAKTMFKWGNNFGWAYAGNMTDSAMRQRVKTAGGRVDGVLRFSIQWNDIGNGRDDSDLDAHCITPAGRRIYFGDKVDSATRGNLDVDIRHPHGNVAVENITFPDLNTMKPGKYRFEVNQFANRGSRHGFRAEIEFDGQIYSFNFDKEMRQDTTVVVAEVTLGRDGQFAIENKLPATGGAVSTEVWGLKTNKFVPVSVVCYSPNYWDENKGIGSQHLFFMLKGCVNPEQPNGFFNEFLTDELTAHNRRVFEALGAQMRVQDVEDQLSGVGFCLTKRAEVIVKVKSGIERTIKVKF